MPRQERQSIPGAIWHITHRCHNKVFLLKARHTRATWVRWLFEARRRYDLCVLDYTVTRNHIHLLVRDRGYGEIAPALQLVAGRTAQAYNRQYDRRGAFWEARYHSTLVASDEHFHRCLAYVDLNMVRAGVVSHPAQWPHGGYHELQRPKQRYRIIDHDALLALTGNRNHRALASWHRDLVVRALHDADALHRQPEWTEAAAVGHADFLAAMERLLNVGVRSTRTVGEPVVPYMTDIGRFRFSNASFPGEI